MCLYKAPIMIAHVSGYHIFQSILLQSCTRKSDPYLSKYTTRTFIIIRRCPDFSYCFNPFFEVLLVFLEGGLFQSTPHCLWSPSIRMVLRSRFVSRGETFQSPLIAKYYFLSVLRSTPNKKVRVATKASRI